MCHTNRKKPGQSSSRQPKKIRNCTKKIEEKVQYLYEVQKPCKAKAQFNQEGGTACVKLKTLWKQFQLLI